MDFTIDPLIQELIDLPYQDLLSLCLTNKTLNTYCSNNEIWNLRTQNEFPGYNITINSGPENYVREFGLQKGLTVKQYYKQLYDLSKPLFIFIDNEYFKMVRIINDNYDGVENLTSYKLLFYINTEGQISKFKTSEGQYQFNDPDEFSLGRMPPPKEQFDYNSVYIFTDVDEETESGLNGFLVLKNNEDIFRTGIIYPNGQILDRDGFNQLKSTVGYTLYELTLQQ